MKKKMIKAFSGVCMTVLLMSGCSLIERQDIGEEKTTQMAEYMAKKILDHDRRYEEKLLVPQETEAPEETTASEPQATETEKTEPDGNSEAVSEKETKVRADFSEILGIPGIQVKYKGFNQCRSYPENGLNSYFVVEAGLKRKLVVVSFTIRNTSDGPVKVDTMKQSVSYSLETKDGSRRPAMTLLTNDMQYLDEKLSTGKSMEAVLVFEVPAGEKCKGLTLKAVKQDKEAIQSI